MREATRASCSKRSRDRSLSTRDGKSSLSARLRPVLSCSATYTAPMPPMASARSMRKSPANTLPGWRPWGWNTPPGVYPENLAHKRVATPAPHHGLLVVAISFEAPVLMSISSTAPVASKPKTLPDQPARPYRLL